MVYSSPVRSFWRLSTYLVWALSAIAVQGVVVLLRLRWRHAFPLVVHKGCAKIVSARLNIRGEPRNNHIPDPEWSTGGPTLFVANHTSYLDITVLGSLLNANFVAKAEIKSWPIYGWCAQLSGCVFVDRRARFAMQQMKEMKQRLEAGANLILFPEGTSGDGNRVLPFYSSLFSAADTQKDGKQVWVQPVTLAYVELDGMPLGRHMRPHVAWYGDMDIADHLWDLMGLGKVGIDVQFHKPVQLKDFESRKELSDYCRAVIAAGLSEALSGREQPVEYPAGERKKPRFLPPMTPKSTSNPNADRDTSGGAREGGAAA